MKTARESSQSKQRVKVGLIGLAAVIRLNGLASAILRSVTRAQPMAGAGQTDISTNLAAANVTDTGGPLADLGITASPDNSSTVEVSRR